MTDLEKQILSLIQNNDHLSEDLKQKYILSLFLMTTEEQEEYLRLVQAFDYRCKSAEKGIYMLDAEDKEKIMKTLDEVKEDMIKKMQSNPS